MMKRIGFVLLLFVLALSAACAATYTVSIPSAGTHTFDFGTAFSSIEGVTISWSGSVTAGTLRDFGSLYGGTVPWGGYPVASLYDGDVTSAGKRAKGATLGVATYPAPQNFSTVTQFNSIISGASWAFLLDGAGTIDIGIESAPFLEIYSPIQPPAGSFNGPMTLTLTGTAVPEPSGLMCLAGGLIAGLPFIRRRR